MRLLRGLKHTDSLLARQVGLEEVVVVEVEAEVGSIVDKDDVVDVGSIEEVDDEG